MIAVSTLILSSFVGNASAAPPKIGSSCTKVGAFFDTFNTRYVCKQEGTKKVWRVWSSGEVAAPKAPAKNSISRKLLKPAPVTGNYGITWANIVSKVNDISLAAWTDAQNTIAKNQRRSDVNAGFVSYVSPGALLTDPQIGDGATLIKRVLILLANVPRAKNVYFVATTQEEQVATQNKIKSKYPDALSLLTRSLDSIYGKGDGSDGVPKNSVHVHPKCDGGHSLRNTFSQPTLAIPSITTAVVTVNVCPTSKEGSLQGVHISAHEYVHTIQAALHPGGYIKGYQPCWMTEGETEWVQAAVSSDFSRYLQMQLPRPYYLTSAGLNYRENTQLVWTAKDVTTYLKGAGNPSTCGDTEMYALAYSLGAVTAEALVSIGGSESLFALDERLSSGQKINVAFKDVYGITWDAAIPILSQVVAIKITKAMSSEALTYQTKP
jgi:hypothetical protein